MAASKKTTDKSDDTFDGGPQPDSSGGAADPHMVMFSANVRVSGPDYVVEADESAPIPAKYAKSHVADGHGVIIGKEISNG